MVRGTAKGSATDGNGFAQIPNIPVGKCTIAVTFIGYIEKTELFIFPLTRQDTVEFYLSAKDEEMDEVIITATRSSRTIENTPTRLEAISGEELEEKGNMKPGDIRMMLNESTGIQTQQTSATSYNSSIRIQGYLCPGGWICNKRGD
jgi:iron complex outermembrane receptor protein